MADTIAMKALVRPRAGKGAARAVRRDGKIPGVIYGDAKPPQMITLEFDDLQRQYLKGRFTAQLVELDVDGQKNQVIPREVQTDPVRDFPIHVDFQRVSAKSRVRIAVAVHFANEAESPGLKRGGSLNIVRHEVEVTCPPDKIPEFFEVDLTGTEIGDSIHWSALTIPEGVTATILDRDFTVATIAGASAKGEDEEAEEAAAAEAAEGDEEAGEDKDGEGKDAEAKAKDGKDGKAAKADDKEKKK